MNPPERMPQRINQPNGENVSAGMAVNMNNQSAYSGNFVNMNMPNVNAPVSQHIRTNQNGVNKLLKNKLNNLLDDK